MHTEETILSQEYNLPRGVSPVAGRDGKPYLQFNTHMVTFYQQTYGELTPFFQALKDVRLIGSHCKSCGQVMVPAATWHCPDCCFAEMEEIELPHKGILAATAPITIFPSSSFIGQAPFCRGYVDVAVDAPIASFLPSRLRTTTGLPRPGIFVKGVALKLVFEDKRRGSITDIFWVPKSEITDEQWEKEPLFASELNFESPIPPDVVFDPVKKQVLDQVLDAITSMASKVKESPRAQNDLAGRRHAVGVKTTGGDFVLTIADGGLSVQRTQQDVDFTVVTQDPDVFARWVKDGSLTDAVVEGTLWLPHREAFAVLPILDRLPRSVRRDMKTGK